MRLFFDRSVSLLFPPFSFCTTPVGHPFQSPTPPDRLRVPNPARCLHQHKQPDFPRLLFFLSPFDVGEPPTCNSRPPPPFPQITTVVQAPSWIPPPSSSYHRFQPFSPPDLSDALNYFPSNFLETFQVLPDTPPKTPCSPLRASFLLPRTCCFFPLAYSGFLLLRSPPPPLKLETQLNRLAGSVSFFTTRPYFFLPPHPLLSLPFSADAKVGKTSFRMVSF